MRLSRSVKSSLSILSKAKKSGFLRFEDEKVAAKIIESIQEATQLKYKATRAYLNSLEATRRSRTGKPSIGGKRSRSTRSLREQKRQRRRQRRRQRKRGTEAEAVVPSVTRAIRGTKK